MTDEELITDLELIRPDLQPDQLWLVNKAIIRLREVVAEKAYTLACERRIAATEILGVYPMPDKR